MYESYLNELKNVQYIAKAIPFFFLFIGLEVIFSYFKKKDFYNFHDSINDLSCGIIQQIIEVFVKIGLLSIYIYLFINFRIFEIPLDSPVAWIICFIMTDFFYYCFHRASHEISFIWGSHLPHHQSEEYNLTVALRQGTFEHMFSSFFFLPLAVVGFHPLMYYSCFEIMTIYQFWIHTRAINKMGTYELIFNTPSHHRVHHGKNPIYIDKNYGGVFIIWDRLLGTYQDETEEPVFGTVEPLQSWNPLKANLYYWWHILTSLFKAKGLKNKLFVLIKSPAWNYENPDVPFDIPDVKAETYQKYRTKIPMGLNIYALLQFIPLTAAATVYLESAEKFMFSEKIIISLLVIITLVNLGGLFEQKKWALSSEFLRLCLVFAGINFIPVFPEFESLKYGISIIMIFFIIWILKYKTSLLKLT
jgi:alkylglycerol monooxygenase